MQAATEGAKKPKRTKGGAVAKLPESSEVVPEGIQFSALIKNEWQEFSNLALSPFSMPPVQIPTPDGKGFPDLAQNVWPSVEHYYQAMKFPTEPEFQEAIRQEPSPSRAKKMGTAPDHGLRGDWETIKERVMKSALVQKFKQNPRLLQLLQSTGTKPTWTTNPADVPVVDQGSTAASPQPLSVPTWSPVPPPPEASPGWVWLQNGPGPAPAWAPPTPPVINTAPLWQGG
jgi:ribA/ribD-fused uncharacterized protein